MRIAMKRLLTIAASTALLQLAVCTSDLRAAEITERIDYGVVESIQVYRKTDNQPVNVGTILGGIAGGVIGHQIGSGRGNTAATIAGAVGGAVVGNEVQKSQVQGSRYRITVHLDSGTQLVLEDSRDVELRVGDRVRVENNRISRL
jgi:outer membrane lipoprotein SlyB